MNIVQENKGPLEAVLKVELKEEDYKDQVAKELKNFQRKAQMPGFRPGKVPFGMVKKLYGKSVKAEEVNKILADAVLDYVKKNELNILGHPVPDQEKAKEIDWENQDEFEFSYHIGLSPEIDLDLSEDIEVDYYKIKVSDDIVDNYLKDIRRRFGKMTSPGVAEKDDVLFGEFTEMESEEQPKPDGQTNKANLYIQYIKDEELKNKLIGAKPGASYVMDILKALESDAEAAAMVGVKKEELANYSPLFRFTVESISRVEPAEINEELFEKAAPGKGIKTEEEFRDFIADNISQQYQGDADKHFKNLVREKLIEVTDLDLPDDFLKKWLLDANKQELTPEQIEKDFDNFKDTFRWQLIENHLIKQNKLEVKTEEVNEHLEQYIRTQLKQYGQEDPEQSMINEFIKNITSNEEEIKKVYEHLFEKKLTELFKEKLKLKEIEISFDDFVKLVTEKYQGGQASGTKDTETEK